VVTPDWLGVASPVGLPHVLRFVIGERLGIVVHRNARFPLVPSELAFAFNGSGRILKTTGPALRDLAGWRRGDGCWL
jgi:hypothetical protein